MLSGVWGFVHVSVYLLPTSRETSILLRVIPTLRGELKEGRAHVLTDYPGKRGLICVFTQCYDACSGIKSGMCFGTSTTIKAEMFWAVF